jgi:hypothetical protein
MSEKKAPKKNLRVVNWIGVLPVVAVCTACNREFKVPLASLKRLPDAQESLHVQFAQHQCTDQGQPSDPAPSR